jgi:hypothetical protein
MLWGDALKWKRRKTSLKLDFVLDLVCEAHMWHPNRIDRGGRR